MTGHYKELELHKCCMMCYWVIFLSTWQSRMWNTIWMDALKNPNKSNINNRSSGRRQDSAGLYEIALGKKVTLLIYNLTWHLNKIQLTINTQISLIWFAFTFQMKFSLVDRWIAYLMAQCFKEHISATRVGYKYRTTPQPEELYVFIMNLGYCQSQPFAWNITLRCQLRSPDRTGTGAVRAVQSWALGKGLGLPLRHGQECNAVPYETQSNLCPKLQKKHNIYQT